MEIVKINLMYYNGVNYKDYGEAYFKNKENLTLDQIIEALDEIMDEPVMVQYYGIPSIAPIKSEFEITSGNDHAFCEITDIKFVEMTAQNLKDIREVIELVEKGGDVTIRNKDLKRTIKKYSTKIKELEKLKE